jgi:prepilin-type processing-associated H-X9-DG protein
MKERYRLMRRSLRGGKFYCVDSVAGTRASLGTNDEEVAVQIVRAKNQALRQPAPNLQIAGAYLAGTDSGINTRTWKNAIEALTATNQGENKARCQTVAKDKALWPMLDYVIIETQAEALLDAMRKGTVSTNVYLRRLHNFCLDMSWLPWPLIPKRQWPAVRFKEKWAITLEEHQSIISNETNPERKAFYQVCWHLGASQGDIGNLKAEDIDWENSTISFFRRKTAVPVIVNLGAEALNRLKDLTGEGLLFPYLASVRSADHQDEFPRSQHSAFAHGQLPCGRAVAPELGRTEQTYTNLLNGVYHCPADRRTKPWSSGQNVYFELNPDNDDYVGAPRTWRRLASIPHPVTTILQAEMSSDPNGMSDTADHIMAHFWTSLQDATDVAACRHKCRSNYNFVDGHASALALRNTYDPARQLDLWNPSLAP